MDQTAQLCYYITEILHLLMSRLNILFNLTRLGESTLHPQEYIGVPHSYSWHCPVRKGPQLSTNQTTYRLLNKSSPSLCKQTSIDPTIPISSNS